MMYSAKELPGLAEITSGIVEALPDAQYRVVQAISKSGLDLIAQSPSKYKHAIIDGNKREATAAMKLGSAFDMLLLEPELFKKTYLEVPPGTRRGTKAWDSLEFEANGRELIKAEDLQELTAMADAVSRHPIASKILHEGKPQVSFFWKDPLTGVDCKARADYLRPDGICVDVKTTMDASPETFQRTCLNLRYAAQAAFYSDGLELLGRPVQAFLFIAVEKEAPYEVAIYSLTPEFIELGRQAYRKDLELYARCLEENSWPGYTPLIQPLAPPAWAFTK